MKIKYSPDQVALSIEDPPRVILGPEELKSATEGKLGGHVSAQLDSGKESFSIPIKDILRDLLGEETFQARYDKMPENYRKGLEEKVRIAAPLDAKFGGVAGMAAANREGFVAIDPLTRKKIFRSDILINPNLIEVSSGNNPHSFYKTLSPEERKASLKETLLHEIRHKLVSNLFGDTEDLPEWMGIFVGETPSGNDLTEIHSYTKDILASYNEQRKKEGKEPIELTGAEDPVKISRKATADFMDILEKKKNKTLNEQDTLNTTRSLYNLLEVLDDPEILDNALENHPIRKFVPNKKAMKETLTPYKDQLNHLLRSFVKNDVEYNPEEQRLLLKNSRA